MNSIIAIIIGALVLFFPGFLLSFLVFPDPKRFDFWERIGTSLGLSALIDMLIITILAQPSLRALTFTGFLGSILAFCGACAVFLILRKQSRQTFMNFWTRSQPSD
ncbi:hypothetical protein AKJ53_00335 [candidate division MSBL1 archaeon SCGC-AAA382F02]|uniref:DUF1616 domain-containing protein n=1 Tax=candidate division MSBL1 archaeon SCGC-AAA382F02 TaxID=1698282 RepID=A0A133VJ24_9EURY|nr:hypothetical protein AKJ53_00335 [candidate division MSBL1 archaeon SCGC-AAA382F02]